MMREVSDTAVIEAMSLSFKLTAREAEGLYWVVKGKINRDIADSGIEPREREETPRARVREAGRGNTTAAAGMAMTRIGSCIRSSRADGIVMPDSRSGAHAAMIAGRARSTTAAVRHVSYSRG